MNQFNNNLTLKKDPGVIRTQTYDKQVWAHHYGDGIHQTLLQANSLISRILDWGLVRDAPT